MGAPGLPLFLQPCWLDQVAGDKGWGVVLDRKGDWIRGILTFHWKKKAGVNYITMPPLTPYTGPFIFYPEDQKRTSAYAYEHEVLSNLLEKIPANGHFIQYWHPSQTNWLPFYWEGYSQTTRYTYRLPQCFSKEEAFGAFRESTRREIRKAKKSLQIRESNNTEAFYELHKKAFQSKGSPLFYPKQILQNIDELGEKKQCRKMLWAMDKNDHPHAAVLLFWDASTVYYLVGVANPDYKTSGAMSLLLWEAICFALSKNRSLDLEGSMLEPVERFFRGFGGIRTPYFAISKTSHPLFRIYLTLKGEN